MVSLIVEAAAATRVSLADWQNRAAINGVEFCKLPLD
jgi:hypothetical protein